MGEAAHLGPSAKLAPHITLHLQSAPEAPHAYSRHPTMVSTSQKPTPAILRSDLRALAVRVLAKCNASDGRALGSPRGADIAFFKDAEKEYGGIEDLKWYTISKNESAEWEVGSFPEPVTLESDAVQLGVVTFNFCCEIAYWCRPVLEKLLAGMLKDLGREYVSVVDIDLGMNRCSVFSRCKIRSRPHDSQGFIRGRGLPRKEPIMDHGFLVITLKDGSQVVFDPSGFQFGLTEYVQEMDGYEKDLKGGGLLRC